MSPDQTQAQGGDVRSSRWWIVAGGASALALAAWLWQAAPVRDGSAVSKAEAELMRSRPALAESPPLELDGPESMPEVIAIPEVEPSPAPMPVSAERVLVVCVVDQDGDPVAEASVALLTKSPISQVSTGRNGTATLDVSGQEEADVVARHPDYRFGRAHTTIAVDEPTRLTLTLRKQLSACVRLESETGAPVGGAVVRFRERDEDDLNHLGLFLGTEVELEDFLLRDLFEGQFQESRVSGPDGTCCISGVTAGLISISVDAPGFVHVDQAVFEVMPAGGDMGVLRLERGVAVTGMVVDSMGPVPGASVEGLLGSNTYRIVMTDEAGRFELGYMKQLLGQPPIRVSHPERGDYYNARMTVGAGPVVINLLPSTPVRLRLIDRDTGVPIEGEYKRLIDVPVGILLHKYGLPKSFALNAGETVAERLAYYSKGLTIEVKEYPRTYLELHTLAEAQGHVIELVLAKARPFLVRAIDKRSGRAVVGGELHSILDYTDAASKIDKFSSRIASSFDDAADGYMVEVSRFNTKSGADEYLVFAAPGYAPTEPVRVSANGVWTAGDAMEILVTPE